MTIYVDTIRTYPPQAIKPEARKHGDRWCHLWTDGELEELHAFAARLGLKRTWFQDRRGFPHYDLTPSKRLRAVALGAVEGALAKPHRQPADPDQTYEVP